MKTKIYIVASTNIESTKAFTNSLLAQDYRDELQENGDTVVLIEQEIEGPHIYLFDRKHFNERQILTMSRHEANELAELPKDERKVWRYCYASGTFTQDFNAGCMNSKKYFIRFI